jgi:ribonuclease D
MRDETLADMAAQLPETPEQLKQIRGMSADMANGVMGKTLLEAIQRAVNTDRNTWPKVPERKSLTPQASATIDILKMLLKIQAAENGVAAKLIATQDELELIATEDHPDIQPLRGWRYDVFGREAQALKAGKIAIGLKGSKITKYNVSGL